MALAWGAGGCEPRRPAWRAGYEEALEAWAAAWGRPAAPAAPAALTAALPAAAVTLPDLRARALPPPPALTLSARDLLSVSTCALGPLLAQRNSPLGRVMVGSQALLYEARFLTLAPRCDAPPRLRGALSEAVASKRARWREAAWRATWGARDLSRFLSARYPRDRRPPPLGAAEEAALRWLGGLGGWAAGQAARGEGEARAALAALERDLEPALAALTPHAGGRALAEAVEAREALAGWVAALRALPAAPPPPNSCQRLAAALAAYALTAQPELARRAQSIARLAAASADLARLLPAAEVPEALRPLLLVGLGEGEEGLAGQLRALSREHARLLGGWREACAL